MPRMMRKPGFWIVLILASFVINIIVAWVTVHKHLPGAADILFFGPNTNNKKSDQIPESVVWHRMLQEHADVSSSRCNPNRSLDPLSLRGGLRNKANNHTTVLLPGGFRRDVGRFVNAGQSETVSNQCYFPPSSSCQSQQYSVVVFSEGQNVRQLFLNLLSFMAYPSVADITLILPFDIRSRPFLPEDQTYGDRIIEWWRQRTVKLIWDPSLWSAMQMVSPARSEAIVWMNGDVQKDWTGGRMKQAFQIWKSNPRILFASRVEEQSHCSFPKLHQLMMHRNFLCYLSHPVMEPIRKHVEASSPNWNTAMSAVTMIWNHVATGHVVIPPTNQTYTKTGSENGKDENKILDYFECDCFWPSTAQLSSLNGTCYQ